MVCLRMGRVKSTPQSSSTWREQVFRIVESINLYVISKQTQLALGKRVRRVIHIGHVGRIDLENAEADVRGSAARCVLSSSRLPWVFWLCLSASSALIFAPARRMRSLPISAMVLNPALEGSDFSSHGSGNCTMMNLRLPPSSALSCMTAWAVVAEPEKKSRMMSSASVLEISNKYFINEDGFAKEKGIFNEFNSWLAFWLIWFSMKLLGVAEDLSITSFKYVFVKAFHKVFIPFSPTTFEDLHFLQLFHSSFQDMICKSISILYHLHFCGSTWPMSLWLFASPGLPFQINQPLRWPKLTGIRQSISR